MIRSLAIDYEAGGREDMHAHPWPQLLYAQSGAVRAVIQGRHWTVPTRRGLWIPAHTPHRLYMSSRLQLRTLYVRPGAGDLAQTTCVVPVGGLLHEAILRVCDRGALDDRVDTDRCLATIICGELDFHDPGLLALPLPKDPRAQMLIGLFFDPECTFVALETLCEQAGLGRRTAERIFRSECGLSPAQWRRFASLSQGLVSLAGGSTIDQAAMTAGYQSRSAFSEAFSQTFGFPPREAKRR